MGEDVVEVEAGVEEVEEALKGDGGTNQQPQEWGMMEKQQQQGLAGAANME